uniref:Reeler domain containing 1 n=1 Tax=Fundulus heteroclitus TaxID=8078 RepID=A0A3Q2U5N7_FUNHE
MTSSLLLWGGAVVLCSVASPILSFSHGASRTSCQEMIPGHIRAHPLDPRHSVVTIETAASSYLPGQLITVTVRSSRDFMGFLLQARSVGGTHTLRCLFEGDTVTHSDKQLKRNLSFVWRAPDMPKGDIRFHITVVQSYFIYWTGIESRMVRDRSPSAWRGSRTKMVDGASTVFAVQKTTTAQTGRHTVVTMSKKAEQQRFSDLKSQTSIGPRSTQKQTSSPPTTTPNILPPALSVMKPTQAQPFPLQIEKIQSDTSTETFRPSSQTGRVFSQSFVTPQPVTVSTGVEDPKSQKDTKTITLPFVPSNTSSSSDSLNISFVIHLSENFTVHQSGGSVSVSKNPSVTSTSSIHSPSPPSEDKPKTTAAHYVVHPNPKPYPNLRPNSGQEIQPNIHNTDTKPKRPSETPENEGKYPDIVPRHRAWELGMLLACSAGLGMALVVGVRYVYRQACGRRTEVTLKDREREYGRGEPGLIQLQECGDLVRVRKLRENSFVLLAEYDILPSATN